MASSTQWTWVWANSERWWKTGKPGVLQSTRLQRIRHDWATEQQGKAGLDLDKGLGVGLDQERWCEVLTQHAHRGSESTGRCLPGWEGQSAQTPCIQQPSSCLFVFCFFCPFSVRVKSLSRNCHLKFSSSSLEERKYMCHHGMHTSVFPLFSPLSVLFSFDCHSLLLPSEIHKKTSMLYQKGGPLWPAALSLLQLKCCPWFIFFP